MTVDWKGNHKYLLGMDFTYFVKGNTADGGPGKLTYEERRKE